MTRDQTHPQQSILMMPFGDDPTAACTLAVACGDEAELREFDLKALSAALRRSRRGVVVWSGPQSAIAQALRSGTAPSIAANAWAQSVKPLLNLFRRHRRTLLMIEERLVLAADPADVAKLQQLLPLAGLTPAPDTTRFQDLAGLAAELISPHLSDLRPIWEDLLAFSQSRGPESFASHDLDALVVDLPTDNTGPANALASEALLLRDQLADLVETVAQSGTDAALRLQTERHANTVTLEEMTDELDILRAELSRLSAILVSAALPQNQLQFADVETLPATGLAFDQDATAEIALLREQLIFQQSELVAAIIPTAPSRPVFAQDNTQIEAAIATMLADLVAETEGRIRAEQDLHSARRRLRALGSGPGDHVDPGGAPIGSL